MKSDWDRSSLATLVVLGALALASNAADFRDPAPPQLSEVKPGKLTPQKFERLTFHAAPKPLARNAVTSDWPRFLGPDHDATSPETHLLQTWPATGPARVWEVEKGLGHTCPAVAGDRVVLFHRWEDRETIECFHAETGQRFWEIRYEAPYEPRFGDTKGPKTSPVIADGRVFTFGVAGALHCVDLASGQVIWKRELAREFETRRNFFGHGSTPLVLGERLIVNLGGAGDLCVAAFHVATGKLIWGAKHEWGPSYASPVPASFHGRECVVIFAGGESRPAAGGVLTIDAASGDVLHATPHRPDMVESVSASSPVVIGSRVFVSASYGAGGLLLEIQPDFSAKVRWRAEQFATYWMTSLAKDGCLFGFHGHSPQLAELVCYQIETGAEKWRNDFAGAFQRGSLLAVDRRVLCLGEGGLLAWLDLSPRGAGITQQAKLFHAPETWMLPALSRGLLYVCQNERDAKGKSARLICYDLRGE